MRHYITTLLLLLTLGVAPGVNAANAGKLAENGFTSTNTIQMASSVLGLAGKASAIKKFHASKKVRLKAPKKLTPSQQRSVSSYQKRVAEHQKKLADYRANPDAFDNKGLLKNAPSEQIRQRIIEGRVRHLEKEIQTFQENIDKVLSSGSGG